MGSCKSNKILLKVKENYAETEGELRGRKKSRKKAGGALASPCRQHRLAERAREFR